MTRRFLVCIQRAVDDSEIPHDPVCYYINNGILMRKWRPLDIPADHEWSVIHQIVVPKSYQLEILTMAHDTSHLGVNKSYHRILHHFNWSKLRKDVSEFCKSCHTCQMVGKPNQAIPKAQLYPIPATEESFSRILIVCVGPLPKTRAGSQFILIITCMCVATRFPEAEKLRPKVL